MKISYLCLLLMSLLFLVRCTFLTKYEAFYVNYDNNIQQDSYVNNEKEVKVYIDFLPTDKKDTVILPLLYSNFVVKGPYHYYIKIYCPIERIESLETYFVINQDEKMAIDFPESGWITDEYEDGTYKHVIDGYLDVDWHTLKTIKFFIEFVGIRNGERKNYRKEIFLKPMYETHKGNRTIDYMVYWS